jgi:hypothetical protein
VVEVALNLVVVLEADLEVVPEVDLLEALAPVLAKL